MRSTTTAIVINRPADEVFAYLSNHANAPEWQSAVIEADKVTEGPTAVGTRVRYVGKFLGKRIETTTTVTAYEPPRYFAFRSVAAPFPFEGTFTLEPQDGGTRVVYAAQGEIGGFFKLAEGVVVGMMQRQNQHELQTLKDLLEHGRDR